MKNHFRTKSHTPGTAKGQIMSTPAPALDELARLTKAGRAKSKALAQAKLVETFISTNCKNSLHSSCASRKCICTCGHIGPY